MEGFSVQIKWKERINRAMGPPFKNPIPIQGSTPFKNESTPEGSTPVKLGLTPHRIVPNQRNLIKFNGNKFAIKLRIKIDI